MNRDRRLLWIIVALALILRIAASWVWRDRLDEDIDGYRGIATMVADGKGYSDPTHGTPTAFRPPLFPLLLAGVFKLAGGNTTIAAVQIGLGTLTVLLTGLIADRLNLRAAWLAPLIVALDPLQLAYTPRVMTEVASAFTMALLLWTTAGAQVQGWRLPAISICGLAFGIAALCRPTIWALLPVVGVFVGLGVVRDRGRLFEVAKRTAIYGFCVAAVIAPWLVRNMIAIDAPVFTTTHGGYTLLLSNNPEFYNDIVPARWGTVWDSLPWQQRLKNDLIASGIGLQDERAKDRWMYARAFKNIQENPRGFVGSCWLKLRRFWNLAPQAEAQSPVVTWALRAFYLLVFAGLLLTVRHRGKKSQVARVVFGLAWCMLLAFTAVHIFYWTNTRMRAPLVAAIALLSARGWAGSRDELSDKKPSDKNTAHESAE